MKFTPPGQAKTRRSFLALVLGLHLLPLGALFYPDSNPASRSPLPPPVRIALIPETKPVSAAKPPALASPMVEAQPKHLSRTPSPPPTPVAPAPSPTPPSAPVAAETPATPALASNTPDSTTRESAHGPATPLAEQLSAPRFDAAYLQNPKPVYPLLARRRGIGGKVILQVRVDPQGHPLSVQLHQSSGDDSLDNAALATVKHWQFIPARQGNAPVAATVLVPITFKLEN